MQQEALHCCCMYLDGPLGITELQVSDGTDCIKAALTCDSYVGLYVAGVDDCLRSLSAINATLHCSREPCQAGHQMIFAEGQIPVVTQQHIWQG